MDRREFIKAGVSAGLAGGLATFAGCSGGGAAARKNKRPNILWIMFDDGRADGLGCYGRSWARTPHLDAIAGAGVRFETAIIQNPVCIPSRTSMKTGCYPHQTGVVAMGRPADVPGDYLKNAHARYNLLNLWKAVGIEPVNVGKCHAFCDDWKQAGDPKPDFDMLGRAVSDSARAGLKQGDSSYPVVATKTHKWAIGGTCPLEPQETCTWKLGDLAIETLKQVSADGGPFFLRISFHEPHIPVIVPEAYMINPDEITLPLPSEEELNSKPVFERENLRKYAGSGDLTKEQIGIARGSYYGAVQLVDAQVGRIVEFLRQHGLIDNTIIAVNSDQGFLLGEHGTWKKRCFYDANVRVPLILSCPGLLPKGKVIDEPVELIDFVPTLLDYCGLDVPANIPGRSLSPLVEGRVKQWRQVCFCEHDYSSDMYDELRSGGQRCVMVRTRQWKLVTFMDDRGPNINGSLYNLESDPDEQHNLYEQPQSAEIISRLEGLARQWQGG